MSLTNALPMYDLGVNLDLPYDNHPLWMRQPYAQLLDLTALATTTQNYDYMGIPIPNSSSIDFDSRETKEGTITVFPHAYLVSIAGYSADAEGFSLSLRDKGAKDYIFAKKFMKGQLLSNGLPTNFGDPIAPSYLMSPWIALTPGQFDWAITSLSSTTNQIQVYLEMIVPVNDENRNKVAVVR